MFRVLGLAVLLAFAASEARGACTEHLEPSILSSSEFSQTSFGTLGFRYGDRFLAFERLGCFDVSRYGLKGRALYVNSTRPETVPTYLAAAVSRKFALPMADVPALSMELFRNASERDRNDVWIGVTQREADYKKGGQVPGSEFGILFTEFDSAPIDVGTLDGYAAISKGGGGERTAKLLETWHALLSQVDGVPDPQERYPVLANSRESIGALLLHVGRLKTEAVATLRTKFYLVKFFTSPEPSFDRPTLEPGPSDCLYISYRIGGESEPPVEGSDLLVLQMAANAAC